MSEWKRCHRHGAGRGVCVGGDNCRDKSYGIRMDMEGKNGARLSPQGEWEGVVPCRDMGEI